MDATSGAGTANSSEASEFTPGCYWGSCYLIFSFMCMFSRSLFVLLYFFMGHCVVCPSIVITFGILKLFCIECQKWIWWYRTNKVFLLKNTGPIFPLSIRVTIKPRLEDVNIFDNGISLSCNGPSTNWSGAQPICLIEKTMTYSTILAFKVNVKTPD